MNSGTEQGGHVTRIGNNGLFLTGAHVAHDCQIGNNVLLVNNATLGGHCVVEDFASVGGLSAVHQFVRIGAYAFIGGMSGVENDVIPFGIALGNRAHLAGLNIVGLKRHNFDREQIHGLRKAYRMLFATEGTLMERLDDVEKMFSEDRHVQRIVAVRQGRVQPIALRAPQWRLSLAWRRRARQTGALPSRIGVLAAGGSIPGAVCEAALAQGIDVHVVALKGQADPALERFPHRWVRLGQVGGMLGALREAECRDIVIVGSLRRPDLWKAGVDFGLIRNLPTILGLTRGGDDTVLKRVVRFFEAQGFRVRGAHEIAPALLAPGRRLRRRRRRRRGRARHRRRAGAARRRSGPSMSARRRSSRAAMCWPSRRPRAPTKC